MRLSRRDALLALGVLGIGSAGVGTGRQHAGTLDAATPVTDQLLAVATAIYPSAVTVDRSFIETYVIARIATRESYVEAQSTALSDLDRFARRNTGRSMTSLDPEPRREVLTRLGVHRAHPNPNGTVEERIRYYVVNDLLYVLFSTPLGGELVGCENPPGYPGGTQAYQRGPEE